MTYQELKTAYELTLDERQEAAVCTPPGHVLLLAVPGSGKTTVLIARLGYLIFCCGVQPESILTMTYTVAATQQLRRRFAARFGSELAARLEFRTINGVCARIIRRYEQVYDRRAFALADERMLIALLAEIFRSTTGHPATESEIQAVQTAISLAKNQRRSPDAVQETDVRLPGFPEIYRAYEQALREREWMDYDDQLRYAFQILNRYPDLCHELQEHWQHLCVDEAQDCSHIQHLLIDRLTQRSGSLFLVGDEDQSIYGFRAACPEMLLSFSNTYPDAQVLFLDRNYRSTPQIVEAAGRFIAQNEQRYPKQMHAVRPDGPAVSERRLPDRAAQYPPLLEMARCCQRETAVLYRDNDSALPMADLLLRAGIPFCMRPMDSSFFTGRIMQDITDIIRFAQEPTDGARFLRIYYKFSAGISRAAAEEAVQIGGSRPLLALVAAGREVSDWTRRQCAALQTHCALLLRDSGNRAIERIAHSMGYAAFLEQRGLDAGKLQLLAALGTQEPDPVSLLARLETLRTLVQAGSNPPDCPLCLSTIHGSKGLEYDRVFLIDTAEGLLPRRPPRQAADKEAAATLEEERRLFYVGMTRAKNELQIFTFRQNGVRSGFAEALFPTAPPPVFRPIPAPRSKASAAAAAAFVPGVQVLHTQFGPGLLETRQNDLIGIRFAQGEMRRFSLSAALQRGVLQLCTPPTTQKEV